MARVVSAVNGRPPERFSNELGGIAHPRNASVINVFERQRLPVSLRPEGSRRSVRDHTALTFV